MVNATIWNKNSTNYDANPYVREHGTNSFRLQSDLHAMRFLRAVINNESIERLDLDLTNGHISWSRIPSCKSESCEDDCDSDDSCPGC